MRHPITKVAAAAIVVVIAVIAAVYFRPSGSSVEIASVPKQTSVSPGPAAADMAPLPIELPGALFEGTPRNIAGVANLEEPRGRPRPPFYAPAGAKNVAFRKVVTCTDEDPFPGEIDMITDGDKEASDGSFVELGPLKQHITIDLGAGYNIYAVLLWHYHKEARVYFDVIVQVSDDADFIDAAILFNNDHDNSSGLGVGKDLHYVETHEGKLIDAKGICARYVRLHSNGNSSNDLNHYIEVEVFAEPAGRTGGSTAIGVELSPDPYAR